MQVVMTIFWTALGYVIGSIPWSLIIGKIFFKKDIREFGSGNLGGTNAGRVLGKHIGLLVIILDALKSFLWMTLVNAVTPAAVPLAGFAVCIGHCFPVFANFKGGKAVASSFGWLLAIGCYVTKDPVFSFVYPFLVFMLVLSLSKMVSLASMVSMIAATVIGFLTFGSTLCSVLLLLLTILVIVRHIPNIRRIIQKKESKVSWIA